MSQVPKEIKDFVATFRTQSDLSAKKYYLGRLSSGLIVVGAASKGGKVDGVILDKVYATDTSEKDVTLQIGGIARVKAGGNISAGDTLIADTHGTVVVPTGAGQFVVGIALEDGVSGDIISVRLILAPTATA